MSRVIGRMEGALKALDDYIHDWKHDEANRKHAEAMFQERVIGRLDKMRDEMSAARDKDNQALAVIRLDDLKKIDALQADVEALKAINERRAGLWGAIDWILQRQVIGGLIAAAAIVWAALHKGPS